MKGREWDMRLRQMTDETVPVMLERMVFVGFRGLLVDVRGLAAKHFTGLDAEIRKHSGEGNAIVNRDGTLVFYDLRAHAKYLELTYGPTRFAALAAAERDAISVLWLEGFSSYEAVGREWKKYHARPKSALVFVNPTDCTRAVRVKLEFSTIQKDKATLTIGGDIWSDTVPDLREKPRTYERVLILPPGRHTVTFDCPPPASFFPADSRWLFMVVSNFSMTEVPVPTE